MKTYVALLLLGLAVVAHGIRDLFDVICKDECGPNRRCPLLSECKPKGCGHVCVPFYFSGVKKDLRQMFGICAEMCFLGSCPDGQECRSNGCGHTCQSINKKRAFLGCGPVCANYCPLGHKTDSNGCPLCSCRSWKDPL